MLRSFVCVVAELSHAPDFVHVPHHMNVRVYDCDRAEGSRHHEFLELLNCKHSGGGKRRRRNKIGEKEEKSAFDMTIC